MANWEFTGDSSSWFMLYVENDMKGSLILTFTHFHRSDTYKNINPHPLKEEDKLKPTYGY